MAAKCSQLLAGRRVPDMHAAIFVSSGEKRAVRAECEAESAARVCAERAHLTQRRAVVNNDFSIAEKPGRRSKPAAIAAEADDHEAGERQQLAPAPRIPEFQ